MTPIETNKHVFFDEQGNVLEGGQIYIGQPNTDPRTNAKTVTFTDAGGVSFTASQPLKTVAGRISYNGKPILAEVDGEHSMLVFDSTGKQTDYYPSITQSDAIGGGISDFSEVTRVGLLLSDIKAFDVAVGNVVENVGKTVVTDDLGAQWLALSATGSPGDDVDLIDFENGLQGRRINNYVYSKDQTSYQTETVELGGDFDAGVSIILTKIGDIVNITSVGGLSFTSSSQPASAANVIPAAYRPNSDVDNAVIVGSVSVGLVRVGTALEMNFRDWTGAFVAITSLTNSISITYNVNN